MKEIGRHFFMSVSVEVILIHHSLVHNSCYDMAKIRYTYELTFKILGNCQKDDPLLVGRRGLRYHHLFPVCIRVAGTMSFVPISYLLALRQRPPHPPHTTHQPHTNHHTPPNPAPPTPPSPHNRARTQRNHIYSKETWFNCLVICGVFKTICKCRTNNMCLLNDHFAWYIFFIYNCK